MFINNISYHLLNAYHIAGTVLSTVHLTERGPTMNIPLVQIREVV